MKVRNPECKNAIELCGGVKALAISLGISPPAVSKWDDIPNKHLQHVAEKTGLTHDQINPRRKRDK
jgi:DNA-binding transcriptional regulator YdaS (Cro superfamily)